MKPLQRTSLIPTFAIPLLLVPGTLRADTYLESGGVVVVEAEHFDSRAAATDDNHQYYIAPDELSAADLGQPWGQYANARGGKYLVVLPDTVGGGQNRNTTDLQAAGPHADYKVQINTTGTYTLWVRDTGYDGSSDSCYFSIPELQAASGGPGPDWYRYNPAPADGNFNSDRHNSGAGGWDNQMTAEVNNAGGNETATSWTISKPGVYTVRIQQREDGNAFDAFVLQLASLPAPDPNIPESSIVGGKPQPLKLNSIAPPPNSVTLFTSAIQLTFVDGTNTLATNSVVLQLDGTKVTPTITVKSGTTTVFYQPATVFAAKSSHSAQVAYSDNTGAQFTQSWSFTVQDYVSLSSAQMVAADTSKAGFIWEMSQVDSVGSYAQNSIARTIAQLAGLLGPNTADPSVAGVAVGPGKPNADPNLPIDFEIPSVINLARAGGTSFGDFTPDDQMPGSPGTGGGTDNQAARVITYVNFPAGVVKMGVNSDDNFRTVAGFWNDVFSQSMLGQFDAGGRGAADTTFTFYVPTAGTYALFTLWENGGGDSNIEWWTVKTNGTRVLLNDSTNGGFITYRALANPVSKAGARTVLPLPGDTAAAPNRIYVELVDGANPIDKTTVRLKLDGVVVAASITKATNVTTVSYSPASFLAALSAHTAELDYTEAGTAVSRTWQFTVGDYSLDKVHSYLATFLGAAASTSNGGGHTGKTGDFGVDLGKSGPNSVLIPDASFLNIAATNDTMSFSIWVKKYDIANSSVFWAVSPSTGSDNRGFQAHTPWSDDSIYFDTAGCCGADTRINANINTFAPYNAVGNDTWWTNWHHFLFSKKADDKKIWIDGQLFFEGSNSGVLPTDFTVCYLGAENGNINNMHAQIDDFAVFATAVSDANVAAIARGTLPTALSGEQLLAYWDFNDVVSSAPAAGPKLTAAKSGGNIVISWTTTAGFNLKSASSLTKPITWGAVSQTPTVNGTTSSVTVPIGTGNQFFQLAK